MELYARYPAMQRMNLSAKTLNGLDHVVGGDRVVRLEFDPALSSAQASSRFSQRAATQVVGLTKPKNVADADCHKPLLLPLQPSHR